MGSEEKDKMKGKKICFHFSFILNLREAESGPTFPLRLGLSSLLSTSVFTNGASTCGYGPKWTDKGEWHRDEQFGLVRC